MNGGCAETIYLDYAATTPVDPQVSEAMLPWITGLRSFGNPSSIHSLGRAARTAIDEARDSVSRLINCQYSEITFTSSGTEADNLALIGTVTAAPASRNRLVISAIEHHAILHSAHRLQTLGFDVIIVPVDSSGIVSLEALRASVTEQTALVSIMHANNEIGAIQPIEGAAFIAHSVGALLHTDAVQSAAVLQPDVATLGCDLLTISSHKIYGPKGAGALYSRAGVPLNPMLLGGSQERERRAGTENVPSLVGFGKAASLALERGAEDHRKLSTLKKEFIRDLQARVPGLEVNGAVEPSLPGIVNVSVSGIEGSTLLMNLDRCGVCASSGAACSSGSIEPSHVLKALGLSEERAAGGIRFSMGRTTVREELASAARLVGEIVERLKTLRN